MKITEYMMAAVDDGYLVGKATRVFGKCIHMYIYF